MKEFVCLRRSAIALLVPIALASCTPESDPVSTIAEPTTATPPPVTTTTDPSSPGTTSPPVGNSSLTADSYCYEKEAGDVHTYARIRINDDNSVSGGIQHDAPPQGGDVSSILLNVSGTADGNTLDLSQEFFPEYDGVWFSPPGSLPDSEQVTWEATPQMLSVDEATEERVFTSQLEASDCEFVNRAMKRRAGTNSRPLTAGYDTVTTNEVQFDAGEFGTVVSGSVPRRSADLQLVGAQAGQTMTLDVSALEDNAVFQVVSPSGVLLINGQKEASFSLPETGTYEIVVAGSRGNATYDLDIEVQ